MVGIVFSIILAIIALIESLIEKKVYNPLTIFSGLWSIIIFLAEIQLFGMYDFSEKGYYIIMIGNFGFAIGYFITRFYNKKYYNLIKSQKEYKFKEKLIFICTIILFLFFSTIAVRVFFSMRESGISYSQMRTLYMRGTAEEQSTLIYGNLIFKTLELYIFKPMLFGMIAITTVRFFTKMKIDKQIVLTLITLALYVSINFGRIIIVQTAMCMILCALVMGKKITEEQKAKMKKIIKKYALPVILIMLVSFFVISNVRKSEYSNPSSSTEEIYAYLAVPIPIMNYWIDVIDTQGTMTYGIMYTKGFWNIITTFTNKVGISFSKVNEASTIINNTEKFLPIFPNKVYNAFVSIFYAFYVDFREFGVFIGSLLYGVILAKNFKNVISKNKNILNCSIYMILMQGLIKCFIRWEFVQMSYCLSFLWIFIFIKSYKTEKETT